MDRADQSQRLRTLAALTWRLDLSYRGLEMVFAAFGVDLRRISAWRDVQAHAQQALKARQWQPVRVVGVDGAYVRGWGDIQSVLVVVDLGTVAPVAIGQVEEKDPQAVKAFLESLV